jgi:hypothetical protein
VLQHTTTARSMQKALFGDQDLGFSDTFIDVVLRQCCHDLRGLEGGPQASLPAATLHHSVFSLCFHLLTVCILAV